MPAAIIISFVELRAAEMPLSQAPPSPSHLSWGSNFQFSDPVFASESRLQV